MWTLLELALIADVASSASATAQNTALASAPEYVKEAHFVAQSLYREKINAPRPIRETLTHDAVLPVALVVIIALIALGYTALGIIMILGWALMALMAWANKVSRNSEFEEKAKHEALQEAWDIVSEKLAKEDAIRNAMYSAAAR